MKTRLQSRIERRESLVARSAALRAEALHHSAQLQRSLWIADIAVEAVRALKQRPLIVAAIVGALIALRPGRAVRWLGKGLAIYSFVRNLRKVVRRS
jgi:hypothetical protein